MSRLLRCHFLLIPEPDPARRVVGHQFLDEIEQPAGEVGQEWIVGDDRVELIAVEDQEPDLAVVVDVVEDLDAHDVADRLGSGRRDCRAPRWATRRSSRSLFRRMTFRQAKCRLVSRLKLEVVEDVAVDDEFAAMVHRPDQELLEQPGLADVAPEGGR
ncbi:MAG: hypothetical protein U0790_24155 [Isosphaeraceae bacterium]